MKNEAQQVAEEKTKVNQLKNAASRKRKATPQPPPAEPVIKKPLEEFGGDESDEEDEEEEGQEIALPEGHISLGEFKGVSVKQHYGNVGASLHKYQVENMQYTSVRRHDKKYYPF